MVAHARTRPTSPSPMPLQCGPHRWIDGYGLVHILGPDNIYRVEDATDADFGAARALTWWRGEQGRRFAHRSLSLSGGRKLRAWLALSLQGRFHIAYEVIDHKGSTLPGPSVVPLDADPAEVFEGLVNDSSDQLPAGWLV